MKNILSVLKISELGALFTFLCTLAAIPNLYSAPENNVPTSLRQWRSVDQQELFLDLDSENTISLQLCQQVADRLKIYVQSSWSGEQVDVHIDWQRRTLRDRFEKIRSSYVHLSAIKVSRSFYQWSCLGDWGSFPVIMPDNLAQGFLLRSSCTNFALSDYQWDIKFHSTTNSTQANLSAISRLTDRYNQVICQWK